VRNVLLKTSPQEFEDLKYTTHNAEIEVFHGARASVSAASLLIHTCKEPAVILGFERSKRSMREEEGKGEGGLYNPRVVT
jgi:hypothetical protein